MLLLVDDPAHDSHDSLAALIAALEQRAASHHDLVGLVEAAIQQVRRPVRTDDGGVPPRRVAIAMGLALQCAPHFTAILPRPVRIGSVDPGEPARRAERPPLMLAPEVLEESLGTAFWEIEELREEVDQRAGTLLKQIRIASWLGSQFRLPEPTGARALARALFPHADDRGMDLVRRGGHLYVLVDQPTYVREASLWLPWLAPRPALGPTSFQGGSASEDLYLRLARGIGADVQEVTTLLDSMVALLPRDDATGLLHLDQWRTSGRAVMTDLAAAYTEGQWLVHPIPDEGATWRSWLQVGANGALTTTTPAEQVFDALALPRVSEMMRVLYGLLMAVVDREGTGPSVAAGPGGLRPVHVDLFDVPRHMRAVLAPLLEWAGRSTTHETIAQELGLPAAAVARELEAVQRTWTRQAQTSWLAGPGGRAPSILTLILRHLLATFASLQGLMQTRPDPRWDHTDTLLMFAAHYLREGRLERLWITPLSDVASGTERLAPVEDIVGHWFWRTFQRLLDVRDQRGGPR